jgi:hypothetical protein
MSQLRAYYSYWIRDIYGKCKEYKRYRSRSFVGNTLRLISFLAGVVNSSTSITSNYATATPLSGHSLRKLDGAFFSTVRIPTLTTITADFGVTDRGIVVGSNNTPVSVGDSYVLNLIPHGTAVGSLIYTTLASDVISPMDMSDPNTWSFRVARLFKNDSTDVVIIREIALVAGIETNTGSSRIQAGVTLARDVPTQAIVVPVNDMVTIQYTILFRLL